MRRMWAWWLAWLVLVAGLATATTVIADHSDTPDDVLRRISAFVAAQRSNRATLRAAAGRGVPAVVLHVESSVGRFHTTGRFGDTEVEEVRVGRWLYSRTDGGTWQRTEVDDIAAAAATGALGKGLRSTLARLGRVDTAELDGDVVVVRYHPLDLYSRKERARILQAAGRSMRRKLRRTVVTMRIESGPGGRLDRLTSDANLIATAQSVTFQDWDADIRIEPPPADEVDTTPAVDEDALLDFEFAPVLAPTDLPSGWQLQSADVFNRDEDEEYCASATLTYGPEDDEPTAVVELLEPDCPYEDDQPTDLDVGPRARFGDHDVVLHDVQDVFLYGELELGDAAAFRAPNGWVLVGTTEGPDVLRRLVASLAPYQP